MITMRPHNVLLLVYRMLDVFKNKYTITISLLPDNSLHYSCFGSWTNSGIPMNLSGNILTIEPLPLGIGTFKTTQDILDAFTERVDENSVHSLEVVNELSDFVK